jgi:hypothetical protein
VTNERRKDTRVRWNLPGMIELDNGDPFPCIVSNLSYGGAKVICVKPVALPDEFVLSFAPSWTLLPRTCRVVWRSESELGVEFTCLDRPKRKSIVKPGAKRMLGEAKRRVGGGEIAELSRTNSSARRGRQSRKPSAK